MKKLNRPRKLSFIEHRKAIQRLSRADDEAEVKRLLSSLWHQGGFEMNLERYNSGSKLWRVVDLPDQGRVVQDFSYPPKTEFCGIGRCNKAGQQVLYTSPNLGTCLSEMKGMAVGTQIRAGVWEAKSDFWCLNVSKHRNPVSKSGKLYRALQDLYDDIGDHHYLRTSVITDWFLGELSEYVSLNSELDGIQALRYPSTLRTTESDNFSNVVFHKNFVDSGGIKLSQWYHLEVSEAGETSCVVETKSLGFQSREGVSDDGNLVWSEGPRSSGAIIPPGATVKFTKNGENWIPDQPLETFSPSMSANW